MKKKYKIETSLSHDGTESQKHLGAVVPPIFQNSLFTYKDWDSIDSAFDNRVNQYIYSRGKNPTVELVEKKLAMMAGGEKAQLFPSGMAAITAACLHFLNPGDHIITLKNLYGPASNLLNDYLVEKMNVSVSCVKGDKIEDFENTITEKTKLIYLESPSTAIFSLQDLEGVAKLAKKNDIKTIVDNTWATPLYQKPLSMGIDLEVHSCSKYLGGHSDIVGGVVIGSEKDVDGIFFHEYKLLGSKVAPFEAWLLLRSLRSLPVRLRQHQKNAKAVAKFLDSHAEVSVVYYPGLESFPQTKLAKKQMSGYTGLMSFKLKTDNLDKIKKFVNSLILFQLGVSWGGHESLVYAHAISYLKELSEEQFKNMGISLGDIRISVGLEHKKDLIQDLKTAFDQMN